jgi:hypothetical protein
LLGGQIAHIKCGTCVAFPQAQLRYTVLRSPLPSAMSATMSALPTHVAAEAGVGSGRHERLAADLTLDCGVSDPSPKSGREGLVDEKRVFSGVSRLSR